MTGPQSSEGLGGASENRMPYGNGPALTEEARKARRREKMREWRAANRDAINARRRVKDRAMRRRKRADLDRLKFLDGLSDKADLYT